MSYVVLVDQPEDFPDVVWVQADSEDQARDRAAEFCGDEDCNTPFRPVGSAELVTVTVPEDDEHPHPLAGQDIEMWKLSVY